MTDTPFTSALEVRQAVAAAGSHFFSPDTMRGFKSRMSDTIYPTEDGAYFVTSERDRGMWLSNGWTPGAWDGMRRYTVRFCAAKPFTWTHHGQEYTAVRGELLRTSGEDFGKYASRAGAHATAKRMAASQPHPVTA